MNQPAPTLPAARLSAILAADAAGYSRLMAIDDRLTVELLDAARAVFREACAEHQGRVVDMAGDSVLMAFVSAASALRCALAVQQRLVAQAKPQSGTLRLPFRIGVHLGDVIEKADGSVYGDGVNVAARLQALAEPDEVFVSQSIRDTMGAKPVARFEDAGEHQLKNVPNPVRAWRALPPADEGPAQVAASTSVPTESLRFGGRFELRPQERRLVVDGEPALLGSRALDLLLALAEQAGVLLTKNQLLDRVWPGLLVEENNLAEQLSALRTVLGPQAIETIPGRGYRFAASIEGDATHSTAPMGNAVAAASPRNGASLSGLTNLPAQLLPLYGRRADVEAIRGKLTSHTLVTLVGAGGIGKSRLAQAVAHEAIGRWPDGVWMVELAGLSDPALVAQAIANALGMVLAGQGSAQDDLIDRLAQQTLLMVIDNCEHLLDAVAKLVDALLRGAPHVRVLATSQEPLRLAQEQQLRVMPLAVPTQALEAGARDFGAVALFEARVSAVEPRFVLSDDDLPVVVDICRRLDGLPLAIELASVRVPKLGLRRVRDKLDERFKLLTGGSRIALRRHQTLRAALEWSHQLINADEQLVFRRLGVFSGGFTMELAQAVAADERIDEWAVIDLLGALTDKSLVSADFGDPPRYRLLESARAYAMEQLAAAAETALILKRHAEAIGALLARADDALLDGQIGSQQLGAILAPEFDNVRAAHAWATAGGGNADLAALLAARASEVEEFTVDWVDWLMPHQAHVERGAHAEVAARFWLAVARIPLDRIPVQLTADAARRAVPLYRSLGHRKREFVSWIMVARHESTLGLDAASSLAIETARAMVQPDWPPLMRVPLLLVEGRAASSGQRMDQALALYRELIDVVAAIAGEWATEVRARNGLVDLLWRTEPIEVAAAHIQDLARLVRARPVTAGGTAIVLSNMVGIFAEMGQVEEAMHTAREAWPFMRRSKRLFLDETVYLFWRSGLPKPAALLLGASDAEVARYGGPRQPNEQRLIAAARPALAIALGDTEFAACLAAGASMREVEIHALIATNLVDGPQPA